MKKRIFVSGLTFIGNIGGPALAISFINVVKEEFDVGFVFSVSSETIIEQRESLIHYGLEDFVSLTPHVSLFQYFFTLLPSPLKKAAILLKKRQLLSNDELRDLVPESQIKQYLSDLTKSDYSININGIAFVGDGTRNCLAAFDELAPGFFSRKLKIPFLRYTQSYGPFNDWIVKWIAKYEFSKLPFLMARGEISANNCRKITKTKVFSFPDIAISLPKSDDEWLNSYLEKNGFSKGHYYALCPSSVIRNIKSSDNNSTGNNYCSLFVELTRKIIESGNNVLFVPHSTSSNKAYCDKELCNDIISNYYQSHPNTPNIRIISSDELDCYQLKAIISGSKIAIVSRYHALIAALSTITPVISIGWNDKYSDILNVYGLNEFSYDARKHKPGELLEFIQNSLSFWLNDSNMNEYIRNNEKALESVQLANRMCTDWMLEKSKEQ